MGCQLSPSRNGRRRRPERGGGVVGATAVLPSINVSVARLIPSTSEWWVPYLLSSFDFVTESLTAVRVVVVASDAAMRRGLALRLNAEPDITVIGTAASPAQARADAGASTVVVLGVRRDDPAVDEATAGLRTSPQGPPLVMLGLDSGAGPVDEWPFVSMHDGDAALLRAIRNAAATARSRQRAATGR